MTSVARLGWKRVDLVEATHAVYGMATQAVWVVEVLDCVEFRRRRGVVERLGCGLAVGCVAGVAAWGGCACMYLQLSPRVHFPSWKFLQASICG